MKHVLTLQVYWLVWKYDHAGGRKVTTKQRLFRPVANFTVMRFEGYYKEYKWHDDSKEVYNVKDN